MEKQRQNATDRHIQLIALLKERGYCTIAAMSQILHVSPMTIRRDLALLQEEHIVEVTYGGARFIISEPTEPDFTIRSHEHLAAKQAIGKRAAEFVEEGDVIGIDSGSTTLEVARNLPNIPLTVVTHSLPAANIIAQNKQHQLIMLGGILQPNSGFFYGPQAIAALQTLYINKLFLATSGLLLPTTLSSPYLFDAEFKQVLLTSSRNVILCMDSSKIGLAFLARFATLDAVSTLVIDNTISEENREIIEQQKVKVVTVLPSSTNNFAPFL